MDQSVPPGRVRGICIPPCSKSYAQRALAASLLAEGTSRLHNIEFCDDTRSAIRCIEAPGGRGPPTLIRRRQTDSAGQTVEAAKEYIRQHYAESDLSVEKLCAYLHLSSTYFSTLFKRETGTSFTAYVTTVRMEAAAEAIRGTEEKTYLIAQRCGYEDPNYFSYVFKRHFGVTPTKYRSEGK